jgi:tetratricopeptide (TPR) repeat protein
MARQRGVTTRGKQAMKRSNMLRFRRLSWPVLVSLALAFGAVEICAVAQQTAPPGRATAQLSKAERDLRLQERNRHRATAVRLANSGKLDDAVREAEAALAIEREQSGKLNEDVAESLGFLSRLHEHREDWVAARKALQDKLAFRERQPDRKGWRVGDARRSLAELERRVAMTPGQRQRIWRASQLLQTGAQLQARAQYRPAEAAMHDAVEIRKSLLGERHQDYATSLNNLGMLYKATGDYARAEPLLRQAMEILKMALGEDHPDYAISLNNLGLLYERGAIPKWGDPKMSVG